MSFTYTPPPNSARVGSSFDYIVAIDFGTTRSAIAFTIINSSDFQRGGKKVNLNIFTKGACSSKQEISKVPTILVMEEGAPDQIGWRALKTADDEGKQGYFARDFKMLLDIKNRVIKENSSSIKLKDTLVPLSPIQRDQSPKSLPLIDLVKRYLKVAGDLGYEALTNQCKSQSIPVPDKSSVKWIVTVPAIWTDQARIFMREAVIEAGLVPMENDSEDSTFTKQIGICLEPEGAALFAFANYGGDKSDLKDKNLLIIDLGGGTADITYHTISSYARLADIVTLEEVQPPSGGAWGGRLILAEFENLVLKPLLGAQWDKLANDPIIRLLILETVEQYLLQMSPKEDQGDFFFPNLITQLEQSDIHLDLLAVTETVNQGLADNEKIQYIANRRKFRFPRALVKRCFNVVLDPLLAHLKKLVDDSRNTEYRLHMACLVGGLGSNEYIQHSIAQFFAKYNDIQFLPGGAESSVAIVHGATRFGWDSSAFGARRARTNYGLQLYNRNDVKNSFFSLMIKKNEDLRKLREKEPFGPYNPVSETTSQVSVAMYESDDGSVKFTTDPKCALVADVVIPVNLAVPYDQRVYMIKFSMSDTVITGVVQEQSTKQERELKFSSR